MDRLYLKSEISLSGDLYEVIAFDVNEDTFAVAIYTEAEVDDSVHWTSVYEKHYPTRKQAMRAFNYICLDLRKFVRNNVKK